MDASIRLEHELLAIETEHEVHVMLEIDVPTPAEGAVARPPIRVAMALDRSGSMSGRPLATVKRAARFLVDRMAATDEIALVTYDDEAELVIPLSTPAPAGMGAAIDAIWARGMTNMSGGWLKAMEEARRREDGVRRVLLLTDGHANQGVTEPEMLRSIARSGADAGVVTTTIGVGDGFDEEVLITIADAAGGRSWWASGVDELPAIFAEEFEDLVALAAQNVSVEVRPTTHVELVGVLNDYPSIGVDGGVQVQVGDVYGGQRLRVVLRLRVPVMATLGPTKVADLVLRYVRVTDELAQHTTTLPVVVNAVSADEAAAAVRDETVHDEVIVLSTAAALEEAGRLVDGGEVDAARGVLATSAMDLRAVAARRGEDGIDLVQRAQDVDMAMEELDGRTAMARKRMHYTSKDMQRNRGGRRGR